MPWSEWEDWRHGMYAATWDDSAVATAVAVLSDVDVFFEAAREMLREWPHAARQNLVHMWSGRNAWVGQATCCYAHGVPSGATRVAWGLLDNPAQRAANGVAVAVREEWERGQAGAEALFAHD